MPVIAPTLRCLESAAGNPLANPVSGCEANDQSDYTGGHCGAPPLPSRLASRSSIRRTRSGMTRSAWQRSQQRPSLIGCASLPKPTIAPLQIEHTLTGVMVPYPGSNCQLTAGEVHGPTSGRFAMLGGKSIKHGKEGATDRPIG